MAEHMPGPPDGPIAPAVIAAYRAARYRVLAPHPFILVIDHASPELAVAQARHGVRCSAFVTACNPYGQLLGAAENQARMRGLEQELAASGLRFVAGVGEDPEGHWPGEDSVLVLGLERAEAIALGRRHGQNTIVWSGVDGMPELVLLR